MHLRKFYILTLFFKLYLFFSIPPHAISSPSKASFELPKKMWSFGHLVIFPFCMLDYWICRSLMKRKTDHLMKRETEQEETRNEVSACSFYILFLQIPLELPQKCGHLVIWSFCRFLCFVIGFVAYLLKIGGNESRRRTISFSSYSIGLFPFILLVLSFPVYFPVFSFFLPFFLFFLFLFFFSFFSFPFFLFFFSFFPSFYLSSFIPPTNLQPSCGRG